MNFEFAAEVSENKAKEFNDWAPSFVTRRCFVAE
jgi:hypothetical protein